MCKQPKCHFSPKIISAPLPGVNEHASVLTQMEQTAQEIHKSLNAILDYQTHHRLREAQGRKRGEDLNERVLWFSVIETSAILVIAISSGELDFFTRIGKLLIAIFPSFSCRAAFILQRKKAESNEIRTHVIVVCKLYPKSPFGAPSTLKDSFQ